MPIPLWLRRQLSEPYTTMVLFARMRVELLSHAKLAAWKARVSTADQNCGPLLLGHSISNVGVQGPRASCLHVSFKLERGRLSISGEPGRQASAGTSGRRLSGRVPQRGRRWEEQGPGLLANPAPHSRVEIKQTGNEIWP